MPNRKKAGKPAGKKPEKKGFLSLFKKGKTPPSTAQQTLPYREMYRDGVCRVADSYIARKKNGSMRPIIRNMAALFPILPRENR